MPGSEVSETEQTEPAETPRTLGGRRGEFKKRLLHLEADCSRIWNKPLSYVCLAFVFGIKAFIEGLLAAAPHSSATWMFWFRIEDKRSGKLLFGTSLWDECFLSNDGIHFGCKDIRQMPAWLARVQVLCVLSAVVLPAALILLLVTGLQIRKASQKGRLIHTVMILLNGIFLLFAGIFEICAFSIFSENFKSLTTNVYFTDLAELDTLFDLSVMSGVFATFAGFICMMGAVFNVSKQPMIELQEWG